MSSVIAIVVAGLAQAQEGGLDAHGFALGDARNDVRAPLLFPVAAPEHAGDWWGGAVLEYANKPWVTALPDGEPQVQVSDLVALDASLGWAPIEQLRLSVGAPLFVNAGAVGDVRATGVLTAYASEAVDAGLSVTAVLPTGAEASWLGLVGPAAEVLASTTMRFEAVQLALATGAAARPNTDPDARPVPTRGGDAWLGRAALSYVLDGDAAVGIETRADIPLDPEVRVGVGNAVELMLTGRKTHANGGHWMGGLGTSAARGAGAPVFRAVIGGGWGTPEPPAQELIVAEVEPESDPEPDERPELAVVPEDALVWVEHPVCRWLPLDEARALIAELPDDAEILLQAPGHLPETVSVSVGEVVLDPAPPQGGLVVIGKPGDRIWVDGQEVPVSEAGVVVANLSEGDHPVRVEGGGRTYRDEASTISGYAIWIRVPDLRPVEVFFDMGSSGLKPSSRSALSGIALDPGELVYEIRGSYSAEGSLEANLALAGQRARTIRDALIRFGVPAEQVRVGEPLPPKAGVSAEEQRRVTITPVDTQ